LIVRLAHAFLVIIFQNSKYCMPIISGPNGINCKIPIRLGDPIGPQFWTLCPCADDIEELDQDFDRRQSFISNSISKATKPIDEEGNSNYADEVGTPIASRLSWVSFPDHKQGSAAGGL
jgi:hypothetical protein